MNLVMQTVLVDLLVVVSLLLVLMVLLQRPRSDGLGTLSAGVAWKRLWDRMQRGCCVVRPHGRALHS